MNCNDSFFNKELNNINISKGCNFPRKPSGSTEPHKKEGHFNPIQ